MASVPPQFADYIGQARDQLAAAYGAKQYPTGWFWNEDLNKQTLDYANSMYQNEYNAYQAELAFNREKELINAQNAYNTPANQLARYQAAGLNPSMIYGQISPGLQTGVANYQPQKAASVENHMPGTGEKLQRAMSVVSTIGNLFSSIAGMASQVEGVKNQNLQNQILEARLPLEQTRAFFENMVYGDRTNWWYEHSPNAAVGSSSSGDQFFDQNRTYDDILGIMFPDTYRGDAARSKTYYQNWWNDNIAPLYQSWMEGKSNAQGAQSNILQYNQEMLESLPPYVRPYFAMFMQFLGALRR